MLRLAPSVLMLLVTGCVFTGRPTGGPPPVPSESQAEMSARFAAQPTTYKNCVDVGVDGSLGGAFPATTFAIDANAVTLHNDARGGQQAYGLEAPDVMTDKVYIASRDHGSTFSLYYLVGDFLYSVRGSSSGRDFRILFICARDDDAGAIRAMDGKAHFEHLVAYRAVRSAAGAAAFAAHQTAARQREADEAAAAAIPVPLTAEQLAQIERARTMVAISLEASARNARTPLTLWATLTLADGSTMRLGISSRIFNEILAYERLGGDAGIILSVWSKDDPSLRVEKEVLYSFDTEQTFTCRGETGRSGRETDMTGGMSYVGQRGEPGPSITVDITTTGRTNPAGEQILRYRLRCGKEERIFDASAPSPITVVTHGGKGGHGIPRRQYAGTNGGPGGDGGYITITADPSVTRYNVSASSHGGPGGNASFHEKTPIHEMGQKGPAGADGEVRERRAPVTIP